MQPCRKDILIWFAAMLFTIALNTHADAAFIRFVWSGGGAGDGISFDDPGNWGGEAATGSNLPGDVIDSGGGDASNVIMQSGGTSTTSVASSFTPTNPFDILIVRSGHTLNLSADFNLSGIPTLVGQTGGGGTVNQSAGTFTTSNLSVGSGATGTFNVSGNANLMASSVSLTNSSTLSLADDSANISSSSLNISAGSTLDFTLGASGVNAIDVSGLLTIDSGALLNIDGSGYTGGAGTIELVNFGSNSGTFTDPSNINISGFTGYNTVIGYDADSLFLTATAVPEPSSVALLGIASTALILRRRKKKLAT